MLYPLLFQPIFQERIWGGRNLERLYQKPLPPHVKIGESWEISDRPETESVIQNGEFAGRTLHWLMQHHQRELLGASKPLNGRFPLLVKILDAEEKLSLQVHPPAHKAAAMDGDPKTEMWYIADARPGAELYVGLRAGATRQEFEERIRTGTVAECFHRIPVQRGDAMFLPSGRVHAIGAGLVIFEIQQNSDTTYRVFDWNRTDSSGKARQLHIRESLDCIDFEDFEPEPIRSNGQARQVLVNDPLFTVEMIELASAGETTTVPIRTALVLAVVEGKVKIGNLALSAGQFCLVPASLGKALFRAASPTRLLLAWPG